MFSSLILPVSLFFLAKPSLAAFQPCPILGPRFPIPTSLSTDPIIKSALVNLTAELDNIVATGESEHGPTTPNTTSFSISLFSTAESSESPDEPFFFEYHHTAPPLRQSQDGVQAVDSDSIYRIGALSQVFTVWMFLIEAGEQYWHQPVTKYVPELANAVQDFDPIEDVDWDEVTLADLASHMAGVGRDYGGPTGSSNESYTRDEFFANFIQRAPVVLPGTTPIFSNAAFQILGYALEHITGKSFPSMLEDGILDPLGMTSSSLLAPEDYTDGVIPVDESTSGWAETIGDGSPSESMYSTIGDLTRAGKAILNSTLISPARTRRWLKPVTRTSNSANTVGLPWEIYTPTDPVIDIFTKLGNIGLYSSYLGLTQDYNAGFAILAADQVSSADLNVHADTVSDFLVPALEKAAIFQAAASYSGEYHSAQYNMNSSLTISVDDLPGMAVTSWVNNGTDVVETIATINGIEPKSLRIRLYPTNVQSATESGSKIAFRAIFQDADAFADSGTPTCITWMFVDEILMDSKAVDRFVFELGEDGQAEGLDIPALEATLQKGE